jgi:hypothetical protein
MNWLDLAQGSDGLQKFDKKNKEINDTNVNQNVSFKMLVMILSLQ